MSKRCCCVTSHIATLRRPADEGASPKVDPATPLPQVSLAPTLALAMGCAIPFGSVGAVSEPFLSVAASKLPTTDARRLFARGLLANARQVMHYLESYMRAGGSLLGLRVEAIRGRMARLASAMGVAIASGADVPASDAAALAAALEDAAALAREQWAQFSDTFIVMGCAAFVVGLAVAALAAAAWLTSADGRQCGGGSTDSRLGWGRDDRRARWASWLSPTVAVGLVSLHAVSFLSNSFVLEEGPVTAFLAIALHLLLFRELWGQARAWGLSKPREQGTRPQAGAASNGAHERGPADGERVPAPALTAMHGPWREAVVVMLATGAMAAWGAVHRPSPWNPFANRRGQAITETTLGDLIQEWAGRTEGSVRLVALSVLALLAPWAVRACARASVSGDARPVRGAGSTTTLPWRFVKHAAAAYSAVAAAAFYLARVDLMPGLTLVHSDIAARAVFALGAASVLASVGHAVVDGWGGVRATQGGRKGDRGADAAEGRIVEGWPAAREGAGLKRDADGGGLSRVAALCHDVAAAAVSTAVVLSLDASVPVLLLFLVAVASVASALRATQGAVAPGTVVVATAALFETSVLLFFATGHRCEFPSLQYLQSFVGFPEVRMRAWTMGARHGPSGLLFDQPLLPLAVPLRHQRRPPVDQHLPLHRLAGPATPSRLTDGHDGCRAALR